MVLRKSFWTHKTTHRKTLPYCITNLMKSISFGYLSLILIQHWSGDGHGVKNGRCLLGRVCTDRHSFFSTVNFESLRVARQLLILAWRRFHAWKCKSTVSPTTVLHESNHPKRYRCEIKRSSMKITFIKFEMIWENCVKLYVCWILNGIHSGRFTVNWRCGRGCLWRKVVRRLKKLCSDFGKGVITNICTFRRHKDPAFMLELIGCLSGTCFTTFYLKWSVISIKKIARTVDKTKRNNSMLTANPAKINVQ